MKYRHFFTTFILVCAAIGLAVLPVYGSQASRLLLNINSPQSLGKAGSNTLETGNDTVSILTSLLSKRLLSAGYQVFTLDDIKVPNQVSEKDIRRAYQGNLGILRKIGALNNASYILNGTVKTSISDEDIMEIKMSKAVTIFSYKLINTATGKLIDVNSQQSIGASRSSSSAIYAAANKISERLVGTFTQQIPVQITTEESKRLAKYKNWSDSTQTLKKPAAAQIPAKTVKKVEEKGYPQIVIINPPMPRSFKVVHKRKAFNLEGRAIDKTGIALLKINNTPVSVDKDNFFKYNIELKPGDNNVEIIAMNNAGNSTTKKIQVTYPIDKSPPELTLIYPKTNRGFAVIDRNQLRKTKVEGLVKDESGILFLRINEKNINVLKNGHFSYQVPIDNKTDKIIIEAADMVGNLARKELKVRNRFDGSRKADFSSGKIESPTGNGPKPVLWGLGIGVSRYKSAIVDLKYADDDVFALAKFFKSQEGKLFSEVHFKTLVDAAVSRESVIKNISTHLGQAAPDDVVFIFIAGHGIKHRQSGSYYFLPYDVDINNVLSGGVRMSDFKEAVGILSQNVGKVVLAMDTCHAGALSVGSRSGGGGEDLVETLRAASGLYILAAAKGGEESLEDKRFKLAADDAGHGVFTYALLKGMSGDANYDGDGYISLNEIFQYVSKQVPRLTSGRQHPYYRAEGTDMPLIAIDN